MERNGPLADEVKILYLFFVCDKRWRWPCNGRIVKDEKKIIGSDGDGAFRKVDYNCFK